MELTHGLPLVGPGFGAFDPDAGGAPVPDLAAMPDPRPNAAADASG